MSYTSLVNLSIALTTLEIPSNYGSGIQWSSGLLELYPNASLQLGLWLVGLTDSVNNNLLDKDIIALGNYLSNLNRSVFLRIGYEFDSSNNNYDPLSYKKAFQHIVKKFRKLDISNVAFVWHSSGFEPRDGLQISDWFPGVEYVDWCGISFFQQPYSCQVATKCNFPFAEDIVSFCSGKYQLPVMIAESTPFGGILDESSPPDSVNEAGFSGSTWNSWFIPILQFIEKNDIKMWNYINCNWDSQPMWQKERAQNIHWGDTRIQHYPGIKERWYQDVLHNSRFSWVIDQESNYKIFIKVNRSEDNNHNKCKIKEVKEVILEPEKRAIGMFVGGTILLAGLAIGYLYSRYKKLTSNEYVVIH